MSRDLEDVLREIGELSNIHADRKKLRANLREIRDHRLAYYNQSNEKELQAEFSDALFKILLLELDEEEEESIEIAELAYLGLGHIFRRPELPTPELYKRRLLLLHYFCDYFTDSIIEAFVIPNAPAFTGSYTGRITIDIFPHSFRASATLGFCRIISMACPTRESSTAGSGPRKRASITASVNGLSSNLFTLINGSGYFNEIESCKRACN